MLPATFAGDDKGNPYTHKLIKTLAFSGCWREQVILRKEHQSIKWSNVDKLPLLFQIVLGDDSSYDSSYNRPFHGLFQPFGMDKLRMIHHGLRWKKRLSISILPSLNTKSFVENQSRPIAPSKSRKFTDVCMVGGTNLPPSIQTSVNFRNFPGLQCICRQFRRIAFIVGKFSVTGPCQKFKNCVKGAIDHR